MSWLKGNCFDNSLILSLINRNVKHLLVPASLLLRKIWRFGNYMTDQLIVKKLGRSVRFRPSKVLFALHSNPIDQISWSVNRLIQTINEGLSLWSNINDRIFFWCDSGVQNHDLEPRLVPMQPMQIGHRRALMCGGSKLDLSTVWTKLWRDEGRGRVTLSRMFEFSGSLFLPGFGGHRWGGGPVAEGQHGHCAVLLGDRYAASLVWISNVS